jgi:hypothetical protein
MFKDAFYVQKFRLLNRHIKFIHSNNISIFTSSKHVSSIFQDQLVIAIFKSSLYMFYESHRTHT